VETADAHFERVKPLFDKVSVGIVNPTVASSAREGSPIAELVNEKHSVGEIVFLTESVKERSRWISPMSSEQLHIKNQFCVEIYCSVQPRPFTVDFDSGLANAISDSVNQLINRLM
jgi:hypothetical protein